MTAWISWLTALAIFAVPIALGFWSIILHAPGAVSFMMIGIVLLFLLALCCDIGTEKAGRL